MLYILQSSILGDNFFYALFLVKNDIAAPMRSLTCHLTPFSSEIRRRRWPNFLNIGGPCYRHQ
jgi:hypothetical protein